MLVEVTNTLAKKLGFKDLIVPTTGSPYVIAASAVDDPFSDIFAPDAIYKSNVLRGFFENGDVTIKLDSVPITSWNELAPAVGAGSITGTVTTTPLGQNGTPIKFALTTSFTDVTVSGAKTIAIHNHSEEELEVLHDVDVTNITRIPPSAFDAGKLVALSHGTFPVTGRTKLQVRVTANTGDILAFRIA